MQQSNVDVARQTIQDAVYLCQFKQQRHEIGENIFTHQPVKRGKKSQL
jgi:hypothetical protein